MNVAAFDLSLTCTGFATAAGSGVLVPPVGLRGVDRLRWIRGRVLELASGLVVLEGYAYARANQAHQLGELSGTIKLALADAGIGFVVVAPAKLKKYATGSGRADKLAVLAAAIRRLDYAGSDHNEADAVWLRTLALDALGLIPSPVPASHRAALAAVEWPEIQKAA